MAAAVCIEEPIDKKKQKTSEVNAEGSIATRRKERRQNRGKVTVCVTTVVSSEVGHVTFFQRSGTCVCGEGTSIIFGAQGDFGRNVKSMGKCRVFICMDSYHSVIRIISKIQYDSERTINSVYESVGFFEKT